MSQSKTEILELIVGLKDIAIDVKKVLKDGKVDMADLEVIKDLLNQQVELTAAFEGLADIKMEEINFQEAIEILVALGAAGAEVAQSGDGPLPPPDETLPPGTPTDPNFPDRRQPVRARS